jgi:hypothetical protein
LRRWRSSGLPISSSDGSGTWTTLSSSSHLTTRTWQAEGLPSPPEQCPQKHEVHHRNGNRWSPSLPWHIYLQETLKPTHTSLNLNSRSHHHPSKKHTIFSTLVSRVSVLCDQDSLYVEFVFLMDVFRQNGYTNRQILRPSNLPDTSPAQLKAKFSRFPSLRRVDVQLRQQGAVSA